LLITMNLSIVNKLIIFVLKLSANNVAAADAVGQTGLCTTNEKFEETHPDLGRYTCARLAHNIASYPVFLRPFDCEMGGFFWQKFIEPCPIQCGKCSECADSFGKITGFKNDKKTCEFISGKKKKKIKKYCRKNKKVLKACPLTCDNCESNAPTDSYVCEDTSYEFTYKDVPFTCAKLDKQYNVGAIEDICTFGLKGSEISQKCPVLCDNCHSASPSVVSSAPSSKPSVSSTTCVDKKVRGTKIEYFRGEKGADGKITYDVPAKLRQNKKCKQLATEPTKTIANACKSGTVKEDGEADDVGGIADYCKLTCDNCGISAAPSITVIEPECDDNDVNTWNYEKAAVTCTDLRGMDEVVQADICENKNGAKRNCISTCNLCPE